MLESKFKRIGIIVSIISLFVLLGMIGLKNEIVQSLSLSKFKLSVLAPLLTMISGLTLVVLSKEKVEDERVSLYRLKAFQYSFTLGLGYIIGKYLLIYFGIGSLEKFSAFELIFVQLAMYLFIFYRSLKSDNAC